RVIQVSALGADADASSAYHLSKREADRALLALHPHAAIVQPSLVFGAGGASARLFLRMAASPLIPLAGKGQHRVQPVHLADLCECISQLLTVSKMPRHVAAVGPDCLTLRAYLEALRSALGLGRAHWLMVPRPLVRIAAKIGDRLQESSLDSD